MNIIITVGHSRLKSGAYTSADGKHVGGCNEYKWCKAFSKQLKAELEKKGHIVKRIVCPENKFITYQQERPYKIEKINNSNCDLVIELHLNDSDNTAAEGCEVLYKSEKGKKYAQKIQKALAKTFKDRGIKKRDDLYMLNQTKPVTVMVETFFCSNKNDYRKARGLIKRTKLARDIAEAIS